MRGPATPAAWYRDPDDGQLERWWDGRSWTSSTRAIGPVDFLWDTGAPALAPPPPRRRGRTRALGLVVAASLLAIAAGGALVARTVLTAEPNGSTAADAGSPAASSSAPVPRGSSTPIAQRPSADPLASPSAPSERRDALAVLATIAVKGPSPMTGYRRVRAFGTAWMDVDRNGCDTRDDVLRRDLKPATGTGCRVVSGVLHDPYSGMTIPFRRGNGTSTAVEIDHVVALADAWRTGAQQLAEQERVELANDPINLFAVDGQTNAQKSDGDAATWLPSNRRFRCTYVAHQIGVKKAYRLWVTPSERDAMARVLARCPSTPVPASTVHAAAAAVSTPTMTATPTGGAIPLAPTGALDPRYRYCSDAKRAGAHTPYVRGEDPEYAWYRDADGDGVVCE